VLQVENVSKSYPLFDKEYHKLLYQLFSSKQRVQRTYCALDGVSFELSKSETLGIIGRNGAGKSTLLQILCGTLNPTEGSVTSHGRIAALLELGAGFNPEFTGRENIILNASIYGLTKTEIASKLDDIIAFADIGEFIDQPVQHYSSGMFVRLAFAVIAHVDADILIIDEALAVGDALFAQKCMRFLERFKKTGSILFVSHDSGAITRLCDRALWLDKGKMRMLGDAKEVSEAYLEHIYSEQQSTVISKPVHKSDESVLHERYEAFHEWHDGRSDLLIHSNLRNDLSVFPFDVEGNAFGTGYVDIADVYFRDLNGKPLAWLVGGSKVVLEIVITPNSTIDNLIVGFLVKNRLGQTLFGENNYLFHLDNPVNVEPNKHYIARFGVTIPYLPEGEYVMSVGVASGTQEEHVQHCWRHDALVFTVVNSHVVHGLVGIPVGFCEIVPVEQ